MATYNYIKWFSEVGKEDVNIVGGKGANLGQLTKFGLPVPPGFCITAQAYNEFIEYADLTKEITSLIDDLDVENTDALNEAGKKIRESILAAEIKPVIREEIIAAYNEFASKITVQEPLVAVRSSATAEDLPDASFAGQQETFLYVFGEEALITYVKKCWASLWHSRAIYYRSKHGYDHLKVALSVVVQKMINSSKSGVMFTANPINNSTEQIMINASWGLGEAVVSGLVTPDEYVVDKKARKVLERHIATKNMMVVQNDDRLGTHEAKVLDILGKTAVKTECLNDQELMTLVDMGIKVEQLYGTVQDTEWGFDKDTDKFYFLQSRPITTLEDTEEETKELIPLCKGLPASPGIARGKIKMIKDISEINLIEEGDVMVTTMTNPDMVPAMRKAVAVVTDEGGRTCHAAIVSRELQIPCIVGTGNGTESLTNGQFVTVDAKRGIVYKGNVLKDKPEEAQSADKGLPLDFENRIRNASAPITATKIYMNLGQPDLIDRYKNLPFDGIGLMRTEFIFTNMIGAHPMYLVKTGQEQLMVSTLADGISKVASEIFPKNLVVRFSDFRTNEFRGLKGGEEVEPEESNPMIGWRGVSRYISPEYEKGFRLECQAIRRVREEMGLTNVIAMLPFIRRVAELKQVKQIMAEEGLEQSKNFKIWIMAEVPAVVFEAEEFAEEVDGFSIGSNDLTQLVMGADRDSGILNNMGYFDERNEAVKRALKTLITAANKKGITCSICGQGPSQYPELTEFLVKCGITSISVNPDTVEYTRRQVASVEKKIMLTQLRELSESMNK
jgi:pyruvate,water dikinase